jgi:hypothetical protein
MANYLSEALNLVGAISTVSDRPSYIEDPEEALSRNQQEALQELYIQHGTVGPNPIYDEEGNIIPQELWGPDLALTPFMSKTSLAAVGSKIKSFFSKSPGTQAANILSKIESKLTPKLATKTIAGYVDLADEGRTAIKTLSPTKFSLFIEDQTRKSLLRKLSTPEEYLRFKRTYTEAGELFKYDDYKTFLEIELYPSRKALAEGVDKYRPHVPREFEKKSIAGKYYTESGLIAMRPSGKEGGLSGWRSTLRHELKHHLDFELTQYGNDDYERLKTVFDEGLKFEVKEELFNWKLLEAVGSGKGYPMGKAVPGGVQRIRYLKEPTETLARLTEIRTKGVGQSISTLLGEDITALKQLKSIYKPEFLDELMRDYWVIMPMGLGSEMLENNVYKDLK